MKQAVQNGMCPAAPADCPAQFRIYPCLYDPSDDPFGYYPIKDNPAHFKDVSALATELAGGTLPAVSFVINIGYKSEHPGAGTRISDGVTATRAILDAIAASSFAQTTLVLFTYDEGGGFFDHVPPPPTSAIDCQPYGTRVPLIAIGRFARTSFISHVTMEHSSI